MTDEDRAAHDKLSKALIANLAPEGAMETQLAQRIATDSWRGHPVETARPYPRDLLAKSSTGGRRAAAIEDDLFALGQLQNGGLSAAPTFLKSTPVQKNLAMLQSLQATRKAAHEAAMKEAASLLKLNEMKGLEYQPAKDGFVFSTPEIHAAIDRELRLSRAATTDFTKFRPRKFQTQAA